MDKRTILRYKGFPVYFKLRIFRKKLIKLLNNFSQSKENLNNQGTRAINSACLNIAEGSNKPTDKEFSQFVNRSLTSLEEVSSVLDLCLDDNIINNKTYHLFESELKLIAEELLKFERSLRKINK